MIYTHTDARNRNTARSGFSLMELMIALAVLGLIMAALVPNLMKRFESAKKKTAQQTISMLGSTVDMFELDLGRIPQDLQDFVRRPIAGDYYDQEMVGDWSGPYLKGGKVPKDPWKKKFVYRLTPDQSRPYELYSYGPNGKKAPRSEWIRVK